MDTWIIWKGKFFETLYKETFYGLADKFIVYERRGKELMIENGFNSHNIYVIFNSLDYNLNNKIYKDLLSKKNNSTLLNFENPDKPIICFIGRLTPQKKLDMLINAFNKINQDKYRINLLIIGEGHERKTLRS